VANLKLVCLFATSRRVWLCVFGRRGRHGGIRRTLCRHVTIGKPMVISAVWLFLTIGIHWWYQQCTNRQKQSHVYSVGYSFWSQLILTYRICILVNTINWCHTIGLKYLGVGQLCCHAARPIYESKGGATVLKVGGFFWPPTFWPVGETKMNIAKSA